MLGNSCDPGFLFPSGEGLDVSCMWGTRNTVKYWSLPWEYTWVFMALLVLNFCHLNTLQHVNLSETSCPSSKNNINKVSAQWVCFFLNLFQFFSIWKIAWFSLSVLLSWISINTFACHHETIRSPASTAVCHGYCKEFHFR